MYVIELTNVKDQINELSAMFASMMQLMQSNTNTSPNVNNVLFPGERESIETPITNVSKNHSVKEIVEIIPELSITVEQFVERVN